MATDPRPRSVPDRTSKPELYPGRRISREEFHREYERMPQDYKAELIGGIVYEPSPLSYSHGKSDGRLGTLFGCYGGCTPGVELAHNATVILGEEDEVQPDLLLRINPKHAGQSRTTRDDYIEGAPELVAEIALTSEAIDLRLKKERYARGGVLEYVVVCLRPKKLHWFDLPSGQALIADAQGIFRSAVFPGLWIHGNALLQLDYERSMKALHEGLQSLEHKQFVAKLAAAANED